MSEHRTFRVTAIWDDEAGVWVATSDDIPGLVTEAADLDALVKRIRSVVPELIEDNGHLLGDGGVDDDLLEVCVQSKFSLSAAHA